MSDLLQGLNPAQRRAVEAIAGPVLVLAGPGSGKTRVLTHRIAHLIKTVGVDPYNILAVTFTNKAAREMKERLEALVGSAEAHALTVGTFHSLCSRFLRRDIIHLGRERDFVIYDSDDQDRLMRRVLKDLNLDEKQYPPRAIHGRISSAKNELVDHKEYARLNRTYFDEIVARCYERYQRLLRESNALDFDDLLVETVRLFDEHPEVLEKYHQRYTYLLVDEYQDTNRAQYVLVKQLAAKHRNLFVVGDDDQCLPAGSLVRTPEGERPIEQIRPGDTVIAGVGRGSARPARVAKVRSRPYAGKLIRATLADGRVLEATPNHMCFARLGRRADVHYVYLMYREDKGYRIGVARGVRPAGRGPELLNGLEAHATQQQADKAWLLRVCPTREQAAYYEQLYAFEYGIPTTSFRALGAGDLALTQPFIDRLYASLDTQARAERLMHDLGLHANYPHYRPSTIRGSQKPRRPVVHFTAFAGDQPSAAAPWHHHRVSFNTGDRLLEPQAIHAGLVLRPSKRQTGRIERSYSEMGRSARLAEEIARAAGGVDVARWAAFTAGARFAFQPAAHLRPSMLVPVWRDGRIVDEEIVRVEEVDYDGTIYDLDVEHLHNYVAQGVVVHNSVYGWRGADIRNILQFEHDYPDAQVILLEQNYRSTQAILDTAQAVINGAGKRKHVKKLWTENGEGVQVALHEGYDQNEEANFVAEEIGRLVASGEFRRRDCAIMYRMNAQSRVLEEALEARGVPLQIVGGTRFYDRKEVKDVLAYLRLAANPYDSVSLGRVINWPGRGIGERSETELFRWAAGLGVPVYQALKELEAGDGAARAPFNPRTRQALLAFLAIVDDLIAARRELSLPDLIGRIIDRLDIREALLREYGPDEGEDRWANVLELGSKALGFVNLPLEEQLGAYLEQVALIADVDNMDPSADAVTCITLHQAKGLEYPVVFLVGIEEGLIPHSRSTDEREKVEEERRLLYVGMTRARQRLYLCYAFRRTSYGRTNVTTPSRFLADIPKEMLKQPIRRGTAVVSPQSPPFGGQARGSRSSGGASWGSLGGGSGGASWGSAGGGAGRRATGSRERSKPAGPTEVSFFAGQRVRHATFGEGVVVSSRLVEGDEEVTVSFADRERRLLASFARLERVEG